MRRSALGAENSPEECLGGCDIPLGAQQEIDGLFLFVEGTVDTPAGRIILNVDLVRARYGLIDYVICRELGMHFPRTTVRNGGPC